MDAATTQDLIAIRVGYAVISKRKIRGVTGEAAAEIVAFIADELGLAPAKPGVKSWYVTDHNHSDVRLAGPFESLKTADAVRSAMERFGSEEKNEQWNLWVSEHDSQPKTERYDATSRTALNLDVRPKEMHVVLPSQS